MLECYKTLGRDAIKVHLTGLRVAQQEILEKGFSKVDEERQPAVKSKAQSPHRVSATVKHQQNSVTKIPSLNASLAELRTSLPAQSQS